MKFSKLSKVMAGLAISLFSIVAATSTTYCLIFAFEEPKMPQIIIDKQLQ